MLLERAIMVFIGLLLAAALGWFLAKNVFSHAACDFLYPEYVSAVESKIMQVENFRKAHGKLPPEAKTSAEVFDLAHYDVLADGTYEIQNICFDCGGVMYRESSKRWHCGL